MLPALAVGLALGAWTLWRAGQEPAVNWGRADDPAALARLVTMIDFRRDGAGPAGQAVNASQSVGGSDVLAMPERTVNYVAVLARDLGPAVLGLAGVGAVRLWRRARRVAVASIAMLGTNLLVVALVLGVRVRGFESSLVHGGFLAPALVTLALWAAVGITALREPRQAWPAVSDPAAVEVSRGRYRWRRLRLA